MALLSVLFFMGLVILSIAIAGWLHIGCVSCEQKV